MRILIAEDDPTSRLVLSAAVRKLGHEVVSASDGAEAWRLYLATHFDAVISDRSMPEFDGIELCRRIRSSSKSGYTYFIFLTSFSEKPFILDGMNAGADDYLSKPLDPEDLAARLVVAARISDLYKSLEARQRDVELLNRQLFQQSRVDALTGLGSRLRLNEDLAELAAQKKRNCETHCLIMCDIDYFKPYNDTYGHLAGDDVLARVARSLGAKCRSGDRAYRYGGEEFLLLVPVQSLEEGFEVADRQRAAVEGLAIAHGASPFERITMSLGIALMTRDENETPLRRLKCADEALYRSKRDGRNRVTVENVTGLAPPLERISASSHR